MPDDLIDHANLPHVREEVQELVPGARRDRLYVPVGLNHGKDLGPISVGRQRVGDGGKILQVLDHVLAPDRFEFGSIRECPLRKRGIEFFQKEEVIKGYEINCVEDWIKVKEEIKNTLLIKKEKERDSWTIPGFTLDNVFLNCINTDFKGYWLPFKESTYRRVMVELGVQK